MRALGAKKGIVIALAVVLVVITLGGWLYFRSSGDSKEPIIVGVTDRVESLDPAISYAAGSWDAYSNLYQGLLTIASNSDEPILDAAESCEFRDNEFKVYACTVRDDLKFTSGRQVTAEDVKFSIERIQAMDARADEEEADESIPKDDKFTYRGPSSLVGNVEAIRTDGRDVVFELAVPEVTFPYILAGGAGSIVDREAYELTDGTEHAVGSGPYRLVEFIPVDDETSTPGRLVLEPNEDYRGALEVSDYPVTIRSYPTPADLADAWEKGEVEVNGGRMRPEDTLAVDRHDLGLRFTETTGFALRTMVHQASGDGPTSDRVVRQAIASVVDREALSRDAWLGTVEAAYSLIPIGVTGHGTPYHDRYGQRGVEEVREELESAGYSLPITLDMAYAGEINAIEAEALTVQLEADGLFEVSFESYPTPSEIIGAFSEGELDSFMIGWRPDFSDPDTYTDALLSPSSVLSHGYEHPKVSALIEESKAQEDRTSVVELFREIHEVASEEAVVLPIWQDRNYAIAIREITGLQYLRDAGGKFRLWELARL